MDDVMQLLRRVRDQTQALEKARQLYRDRLAPDFNTLDFIDALSEVRLSQVIAWLMNPRATHGQGGTFLSAFLDVLEAERDKEQPQAAAAGEAGSSSPIMKWNRASAKRADVRCEESTDARRRIDIVAETADWTLGIENKLRDAPDGTEQVSDYLKHLGESAGRSSWCLVYLTKDGRLPAQHSRGDECIPSRIGQGQFKPMSVDDLVTWLQRCRAVCRAQRVSAFIEDFERFLEKELKGIRDMTEHDLLLKLLTESRETVESAMKIALVADNIKYCLIDKFIQDIKYCIAKTSADGGSYSRWGVENDNLDGRIYGGIRIIYPELTDYHFRIEFMGPNYNRLAYGVRRNAKKSSPMDEDIRASLPGGHRGVWWIWRQDDPGRIGIERDWGSDVAPWGKIADGTMAEKLFDAAKEVHASLEKSDVLGQFASGPHQRS